MDIDFRELANDYIRNITPYQPGKPIEELERELGITSAIKLASNENPLGMSPKALAAAMNALQKSHIYPDGGSYELKQALAKYLNVSPLHLTMGNGSENVLEIIVKAYLDRDDEAIISQYAFLTIALLVNGSGAKLVSVPAHAFGHDIKNMVAAVTAKTRMIFIVNPNNPTGTYTNLNDMRYLLDAIPKNILIVVDEAYREYIDCADYPDMLNLLDQYPNLIITRTFSKAYGLAALRLGFAISSPAIADILNRARLPFNVNSVASSAAIAALADEDHIKKSVTVNKKGMQQMTEALTRMGFEFIPSVGNFVTINVKSNAADVYQKLLYEGVIVRPLMAYGMPTHIRVTIGTFEQNVRFLRALEKLAC